MRRRAGVAALMASAVILLVGAGCDETPRILFGATVEARSGQTQQQAVQQLESELGRPLAASREFRTWESPFPTQYDTWLRDTGHVVVLSVKPKRADGTIIAWRDIAHASPGSTLDQEIAGWADRVKGYGARGATNARFLWVVTDYAFEVPSTDRRFGPNWYPGDQWVDDMAADSYNWYTCRPSDPAPWALSPAPSIDNFRRFGAQHPAKRLWLAEWASTEDPADPRRKGAWISATEALLAQPAYAQFTGVTYFDYLDPTYPACHWPVLSSPQAFAAFKAMGADPVFGATTLPK